jgi:hypothetical protein
VGAEFEHALDSARATDENQNMKKILVPVAAVLALALAGLFLARNLIARKAVELGASTVTGFPLEIGAVNLGLLRSRVEARDIRLRNRGEFEEPLFVDMPRLQIDYRLGSVLAGAPHIREMTVEIRDLLIVKNARGESNTAKLRGVLSSGGGSTRYTIDVLHLKFNGKVIVKDHSAPRPTERTFPLNVNVTYHNITEATPITRLALQTVAAQTRVPDLGVKPEELRKGLDTVAGAALDAGRGALDTLKQFVAPGPEQQP